MDLKLIFASIPLILLPSCLTIKLAEANKRYMTDSMEIRDDAKAEGYLVSTKGGNETYRFRNVLHEKSNSPRVVEISVPENRTQNRLARMTEVDGPYEAEGKVRYSLRVVQQKEILPLAAQVSTDSREFIIGKDESSPRLLVGLKGRRHLNHMLSTDLRKVRRSDVVAGLRCLGYVGTLPADAVMAPVYFCFIVAGYH